MTDRANGSRTEMDSAAESRDPDVPAAVETVEAYETEDGIVLYDAENPLAWVQSTDAVALSEPE
ncbi:MAG: hypothetical protein ABEI77_01505 [Halorientalis sp.]